MAEKPKSLNPVRLLQDLRHNKELRQEPVAGAGLEPQLALLRTWQSNRLAQTYADLLADPRYAPACAFFLSDIYAPRDFSQRDHDIQRIYAFLSRVVPPAALQLLTDTIALNNLTQTLDAALLRVLVDRLGVVDTITVELYAAAYRLCDNYDERLRQIHLITTVVKQVGEGARLPVVGTAMKLVKGPAHHAGWFELYDFIQRGYAAFKHMAGADEFAYAIAQRETRILDQIFSGHPDPFAV